MVSVAVSGPSTLLSLMVWKANVTLFEPAGITRS